MRIMQRDTELEKMLPMLGERDVVVGVRTYQDDESHSRRIIGLCAQLLAHIIVFRKPVIDSQCGFKLFSQKAARKIFPYCRVNGGMLDVELFYLIQMFNIPCYYQPVHWNNKPDSKVSILRSLFVDTYDMVKIRMVDTFGGYAKPLEANEQPWSRHQRRGKIAARAFPPPHKSLRSGYGLLDVQLTANHSER